MILRTALLALFAAAVAVAADPFVGTWKPNLDHWKDSPGAPEARKSQMLKLEAAGKDAYHITALAPDGKPVNSADMILDGKERQVSETDTDLAMAQRLSKTHIRRSAKGPKGAAAPTMWFRRAARSSRSHVRATPLQAGGKSTRFTSTISNSL